LKKTIYQLALLSFSLVSIQYLWIPLYEQSLAFVTKTSSGNSFILQFYELTGYDIRTEHMLNMWMVAGFGGYMTMGLFCGVLDLVLPIHYKTQQSRSYFTLQEFVHAVALSLFNLFVSSWIISLPYSYYKRLYPSIDPLLLSQQHDEAVAGGAAAGGGYLLSIEVLKFVICVLIVEIWFYCTHYLLHQRPFYSHIHKIHHRFKAPIAVASMYAHPLEFISGNLLGVVLGPMLTRCHPLTSYVWIHNALMSTGGSHSGYKMFYADFHDAHHQYFDYNFGIGLSSSSCTHTSILFAYTPLSHHLQMDQWINSLEHFGRAVSSGNKSKRRRNQNKQKIDRQADRQAGRQRDRETVHR
jgi:sterol desaturase/sphingolipid hydroxylase (fatty acid hydroxylase superfamily)